MPPAGMAVAVRVEVAPAADEAPVTFQIPVKVEVIGLSDSTSAGVPPFASRKSMVMTLPPFVVALMMPSRPLTPLPVGSSDKATAVLAALLGLLRSSPYVVAPELLFAIRTCSAPTEVLPKLNCPA